MRPVINVGHYLEYLALRAQIANPRLCIVQLCGCACGENHRMRALACGFDGKLDAQAGTDTRHHDDFVS
ncbi:hypothetical protein D3C87_2116670 [compost metagenome]